MTGRDDAAGDMLFLEGLEVPCRVGCTDPERATPQSLRVDMRLYCASLRDAAIADDLERTVDYRLAGELIDAVQGREYLLIERVAEDAGAGGAAQSAGRPRHRPRQEAAAGAGPRMGGRADHAGPMQGRQQHRGLARRAHQHARAPLRLLSAASATMRG